MAISKTFIRQLNSAWFPSTWSGAGLWVDRLPVTADLKMVMSVSGGGVPVKTTIPRDTEGGTIRFTESIIDHQLNGQDFRLIRHEPYQSSVARPVRTS